MSTTKRVIKAGRLTATSASGKTKIKEIKINNKMIEKPVFGLANISKQRNGSWKGNLGCINGNAAISLDFSLPKGSLFVNGKPLPENGNVMMLLPDINNPENIKIYPFDPLSNPAVQKGGIGKGQIKEGAQDPGRTSDPNQPVQFPLVTSYWVNGAVYKITTMMRDAFGLTLYPNEEVFFEYMIDERGEIVVLHLAKSEGSCPEVGPAESTVGTDPTKILE